MAEDKQSLKTYTLEDISKHNNKDSLWLLINNKVYDVTQFQEEHPGGEEPLLGEAGKDATEQFDAVGHSADAKELMKQYRIGELCEEDRKVISIKRSGCSDKCFWMKILVPVGVVLAAIVVYKTYVHYRK